MYSFSVLSVTINAACLKYASNLNIQELTSNFRKFLFAAAALCHTNV
jgi:hypothetical protein